MSKETYLSQKRPIYISICDDPPLICSSASRVDNLQLRVSSKKDLVMSKETYLSQKRHIYISTCDDPPLDVLEHFARWEFTVAREL